ncbi:carbohydrate binding domain-containing protein [Microbispora sp. KK1-11]|uniref:carbohydrate binding domain-containing protein n=1 Tax=Microbispora sp. KK1-11 TaxID=2053005 RepID=UPI00115B9C2B|nr:carbohydrate binding domain-containing protein [Microbispora sp. KK1-11]TQS29125.1 hypothetical protein FLW16_12325 [Microbispora sp. KK1-11]
MPHAPIVEVDWPNTNTWTDVTRYVRDESGIQITRGRGDEQGDIQPGTMSLTFHNPDGRFTPGLATGAYWPNVRKNRPIRCRLVTWTKNMVTNSGFETNINDWSAAGTVAPSLARSTTRGQVGSASLLVTWGTGGTGPAAQVTVYGFEIGEVYTASAYVWVPSGGSPAVRLGVSGVGTGTASSTTNAFQRITFTWTATDTWQVLQITPSTSPTSGQQVWVDAVQVERGGSASAYSSTDAAISTRFIGTVNEWPVAWLDGPGLALSDVTASDLLKRLGRLNPMRSLLEEEMLFQGPHGYWTLGDDSDSTSAGDTSGYAQESLKTYQVAGAGGVVDFGAADGPGTDDIPAPRFTPYSFTQGKGLRANLASATGGIVVACWINTTVGGRDFLQVCNRFTGLGGAAVVLDVTPAGFLQVGVFLGDDFSIGVFNLTQFPAGFNLADGKDHLVALQIRSDGGVFATIDGVAGATGFGYGSIVQTDLYDRIVVGGFKSPDGSANLFDGVISHVWYMRRNTMPDWTYAYSAGAGTTESTPQRFLRVYGLLHLEGAVRGSSTTQMSPQVAGGSTPLQALRDVAAVEAGLVYADRELGDTVVLECRNWRYNEASSVTLVASDLLDDLKWSDDDQPIVNDVTHRRDGGADQRVTNAASIDEYGTYDDSKSSPWATDDDALAAAQWAVYKGADPPPRITQVTFMANTRAQYASILGVDISDVITLTGLPAPSPTSSMDLHVEGYSETISLTQHRITFNTSPAAVSQVWQLGVPGRSELGVTTRIGL